MYSHVRNLAVILSSGLLALIAPSVFGQSGNFVISQHGKPVGSANYSFSAGPQGNDSTSMVRVEMQGLNYSLSKTEALSVANHLRRAQLSATINGSAVTVIAAPEGAQMVISISANGHSTATRLTPREEEILTLLSKGFVSKEIAARLGYEDPDARVSSLTEAISRFQARHGLAVDGKLGRKPADRILFRRRTLHRVVPPEILIPSL